MYKKLNHPNGSENTQQILRIEDNAFIPKDEANTDYIQYLEWLADGGVVEPADTPEEAE